MIKSTTITSWVTVVMVVVFFGSMAVWYITWPRLPRDSILLTGDDGGQYFKLGNAIEASVQQRLGNRTRFRVEATSGSKHNFMQLTDPEARGDSGEARLAIVQGGSVPIQHLATIAPLYPELVHVIVRADSDIVGISDLSGRRIALGVEGSGERMTAANLLEHYDISVEQLEFDALYFNELLDEDSPLEGAIVTTGIQHPDLIELLETKRFRLLSIDIAPAVEMADPFLRQIEIPKGLYGQNPPVPSESVTTLATTAYLVTSEETNAQLVEAVLESIYDDNLRVEFPNLIARSEATSWVSARLHPVARSYFHPADRFGFMATVLESLAAVKELFLAIAALVYLLWQRWRRTIQRERQRQFSKQKEHLDVLLQQTLRIETALTNCSDLEKLVQFLDQVTTIKVNTLREFTDEEVRGDDTFSIFLQQCDSLINRIQLRMIDAQHAT